MLESTLADLTASARRTSGELPPPLVGATSVVLGSKLYVQGGRLVPKRVLVSDLYCLDLESLEWTKLWPPKGQEDRRPHAASPLAGPGEVVEELDKAFEGPSHTLKGPAPRYFHSADAHGDCIYYFGGMGYQAVASRSHSPTGSVSSRTSRGSTQSKASRTSKSSKNSRTSRSKDTQEDSEGDNYPQFCVLGDLFVYNTVTNAWSFPHPTVLPHSAATASPSSSPKSFAMAPNPSARYAHLSCITNNTLVILGGQDLSNRYIQEVSVLDLERMVWIEARVFAGHAGTYRSVAVSRPVTVHPSSDAVAGRRRSASVRTSLGPESAKSSTPKAQPDGLVNLSYSTAPARDAPEPIWLFSNFSFANVKRALDMISAPRHPNFACPVTHLTHLMSTGPSLPPGLRFPTGAIVGHHLIIAGIYLSQQNSSFAIWALDLSQAPKGGKLSWQKIDPGSIMADCASWTKAFAWRNTIVVLGNRDRDISQDYDHRQLNWTHAAFVDLEAFGIYQPPLQLLPPPMQQAGLDWLANPAAADFEIICSDGTRLGCSQRILMERWPWFREEMEAFCTKASKAAHDLAAAESDDPLANGSLPAPRVKPPRTLDLPESPQVVYAALQYFHTLSLCTAHQLQTNILISLLFFARNYDIPNLRALVCHALHGQVSQTASAAAAIYEASTFLGAYALAVRALKKLMISSSQQRQPKASR